MLFWFHCCRAALLAFRSIASKLMPSRRQYSGSTLPKKRADAPILRKPKWIRVKAPGGEGYERTRKIMKENGLVTDLWPR